MCSRQERHVCVRTALRWAEGPALIPLSFWSWGACSPKQQHCNGRFQLVKEAAALGSVLNDCEHCSDCSKRTFKGTAALMGISSSLLGVTEKNRDVRDAVQ